MYLPDSASGRIAAMEAGWENWEANHLDAQLGRVVNIATFVHQALFNCVVRS